VFGVIEAECRYAECRLLMSVVMLNVIMISAIMLNDGAPIKVFIYFGRLNKEK
jgi:hypothetical protein